MLYLHISNGCAIIIPMIRNYKSIIGGKKWV